MKGGGRRRGGRYWSVDSSTLRTVVFFVVSFVTSAQEPLGLKGLAPLSKLILGKPTCVPQKFGSTNVPTVNPEFPAHFAICPFLPSPLHTSLATPLPTSCTLCYGMNPAIAPKSQLVQAFCFLQTKADKVCVCTDLYALTCMH